MTSYRLDCNDGYIRHGIFGRWRADEESWRVFQMFLLNTQLLWILFFNVIEIVERTPDIPI